MAMYLGSNKVEIGTSSGGSGSSDFSTATVTIDGDNDSAYAYFTCATYSDDGTYANADGMSGDSVGVVLYKGVAMCDITCDSSFTTSGNIEYDEDFGGYFITGDCTITIS